MKLLRHGEAGAERPGMVDRDGNIRPLAAGLAPASPVLISSFALA
jgi:hypothetical protein